MLKIKEENLKPLCQCFKDVCHTENTLVIGDSSVLEQIIFQTGRKEKEEKQILSEYSI